VELIASLMAVGFTEYEAKVYLELLRENPATGYQLSKQAGVPRSMVYEALGRLRNRGAVLETVEERATLYRPLPPDVLLDNHEQEQLRLLSGLREGLHLIYTARQEDHLWSISGRTSVLSYAANMIREAQRELLLVLADPELDALRAEITHAHKRHVALSTLLTGKEQLDLGQVARHPPLESELQHLTGMSMVIADDGEVLIMSTGLETSATITRNHNLVFIARQFVWMELFTQRVYARLGGDLLARLDPPDRQIFESLPHQGGKGMEPES
jgi:Cd2+/Zn2+-exporting ATPase